MPFNIDIEQKGFILQMVLPDNGRPPHLVLDDLEVPASVNPELRLVESEPENVDPNDVG